MKRIVAPLVLFLLIALAAAADEATSTKKTVLRSASKGKWEANLQLLSLGSRNTICRLAESYTRNEEKNYYNAFLEMAKQSVVELDRDLALPLSYECSLALKFNGSRLLSFKSETATYMGGAHGMTYSRTYNFGFVNGKPARFRLWDALKSDPESKYEMHMVLLEKAMALRGADWIDNGDVTEFDQIQYDRFWVSGKQLVFEFDPYELGPYSSGAMSVRVNLKDITSLIRQDGPLGFLVSN